MYIYNMYSTYIYITLYIYVYIYICIHVFFCIYIYIYMHIYIYIHIINLSPSIPVSLCIYIHLYSYMFIYPHLIIIGRGSARAGVAAILFMIPREGVGCGVGVLSALGSMCHGMNRKLECRSQFAEMDRSVRSGRLWDP